MDTNKTIQSDISSSCIVCIQATSPRDDELVYNSQIKTKGESIICQSKIVFIKLLMNFTSGFSHPKIFADNPLQRYRRQTPTTKTEHQLPLDSWTADWELLSPDKDVNRAETQL